VESLDVFMFVVAPEYCFSVMFFSAVCWLLIDILWQVDVDFVTDVNILPQNRK